MKKILDVREDIHNHFMDVAHAYEYGKMFADHDMYVAFCTAKFLIQDTAESIGSHMHRDFSDDPMHAYIEFWGVMQAIVIQQDAISEIHLSVLCNKLDTKSLIAWTDLRDFRNVCAGHPAKKNRGISGSQRTFMGRMKHSYDRIEYETYHSHTGDTSHPKFNLRAKIDKYDAEAAGVLAEILVCMKAKWPKN